MTSSSTGDSLSEGPPGRGLHVRHLWAIVALGAIAFRSTAVIQDNSFLWHVRAGTIQLDAGEVLRTDPFSFTAFGEAWRTQSWLLELGYGFLERATGGLDWVRLFLFVVGAATVLLVGVAAQARASDATAAGAAMVLVTWTFWFFLVPRPVAVSFVLLAATMVVLSRPALLSWTLPALLWIWAAVHGTFVIGLGLIVLEAIRQRSALLAKAAGLGFVATLFTAHGVAVWGITLEFLANREALGFLSEWAPPDFQNPALWPFLIVLLGLLVAAIRGSLGLRDLIVVFPFVVLGLTQQRTVLPAMLVLLPYAAPAAIGLARRARGSSLLNWGVAVAIAVFAGIVLLGSEARLSATRFPSAELTAALDETPVFNDVRTGGFLMWAEGPGRRVFIDDRAELYGAEGFRELVDAIEGRGWGELFERHEIGQAIVDPEWTIAEALTGEGWVEVVDDGDWVLLGRP